MDENIKNDRTRTVVRFIAFNLILIGILLVMVYYLSTLLESEERKVGIEIFNGLEEQAKQETEEPGGSFAEQGGVENQENLTVYSELVGLLREGYANDDIVAYIRYPEAGIEYPIVQGVSTDEYLRRDLSKKYAAGGSIILDSDNKADFMDVASIVYGHNMRNKSMFGKLESHVKSVGLGETFFVYTETERIAYQVIAYGLIEPSDRVSYIVTGTNGYPEFLKGVSSKAEKYQLCVNNNRFITLVTCTYLGVDKKRFGVVCAETGRVPYAGLKEEVVENEDILRIQE